MDRCTPEHHLHFFAMSATDASGEAEFRQPI
jgi:hypothetical protein